MQQRAGSPAHHTEQLLRIVSELTRELHPRRGIPQVTLDSHFDRDLGFDSLARMELMLRVERAFGRDLPETLLASADTPRDLLDALAALSSTMPSRVAAPPAPAPEGAVTQPADAATLLDVLDWHVRLHPHRIHIVIAQEDAAGLSEETITHLELRDQAEIFAAGLQAHGLQPGEAVAIMLPTGRDYFFAFFGILLAGGIPVPLYPPLRTSQLEDHLRRQAGILSNCRARVLLTLPEAKVAARLLQAGAVTLRTVVTASELCAAGQPLSRARPSAGELAFLQYTSGSTGNPKGVMLTHANLLANIRTMGRTVQASAADVFVSWLPLYHDMGLIGAWFGSLYYGMRLVVMSPLAFLSRPARWLWAIHRHRGTLSAAPNFAYELCTRRIDDSQIEGLDLSSWRLAFNGAEAVSADTIAAFAQRFGRYGVSPTAMTPVYGLAECCVGLAFPPLGRGPVVDSIDRDLLMQESRAIPIRPDRPARAASSGVWSADGRARYSDRGRNRSRGGGSRRGSPAVQGTIRHARLLPQPGGNPRAVARRLARLGRSRLRGQRRDLHHRARQGHHHTRRPPCSSAGDRRGGGRGGGGAARVRRRVRQSRPPARHRAVDRSCRDPGAGCAGAGGPAQQDRERGCRSASASHRTISSSLLLTPCRRPRAAS